MVRPSFLRMGLTALLLLATPTAFLACSSDRPTRPNLTAADTEVGLIPLPEPGPAYPKMPVNFRVRVVGGCSIHLQWDAPIAGTGALVTLDGVQIQCLEACRCAFMDQCKKGAGPHTYALRFTRDGLVGPAAIAHVMVSPGGGRDEGSDWVPVLEP